jgi:hypothetical protein
MLGRRSLKLDKEQEVRRTRKVRGDIAFGT